MCARAVAGAEMAPPLVYWNVGLLVVEFRLDKFYRINRRALIWAVILGLLFIMRDFFALIFLTFLLVSFTIPIINYFQRETRVPRKAVIIGLYLCILAGLFGLFSYIIPRIVNEAYGVAGELTNIQAKVLRMKDDVKKVHPSLKPVLDRYVDEEMLPRYLDSARSRVGPVLTHSAKLAFAMVSTVLLSLLFSFLIVLDISRLTTEIRRLEHSRLHDFYQESAKPVVRFAAVIARSFRAQALIAMTNTILTLVGFFILGLPSKALLTIIVFFCSFIPVLGVFISTTPAVLVAINASGYGTAGLVIVLVTIVHLIEAYVLNPFIYGRHLKLNPVLVLIILFVGHHFFGLWGMLLGVPVAYYFLHYVFLVPLEDGDTPASDELAPGDLVSADSGPLPHSRRIRHKRRSGQSSAPGSLEDTPSI